MGQLNNYNVPPLSRKTIRENALRLRKELNITTPYFPIVEFGEAMYQIGIDMDVISDEDWCKSFDPKCHAFYDLIQKRINIRESIYLGACNDIGRDRFTLAHEVAHALLLSKNKVFLRRSFDGQPALPCVDPEWQASCYAGELLMPYDLCRDMSIKEIMDQCRVSEAAARCQKNKFIRAI